MSIPKELLANVQAYCQEPAPSEMDLLTLHQCWDAAAGYLAGAGVREPEKADPSWSVWLQVMCALTLDGYDQRGAQFDQGKLQDNPAWQKMKNQLKFYALPGDDVSKSDTPDG